MNKTMNKPVIYQQIIDHCVALCDGESDVIAKMATVAAELKNLPTMDWVGFYRAVGNQTLKIGPYQGGHGCLTIDYSPSSKNPGVCGTVARSLTSLIIPDVRTIDFHIACSSTTLSEIVIPVFAKDGAFLGVLDGDSNQLAAFDDEDQFYCEKLVTLIFS